VAGFQSVAALEVFKSDTNRQRPLKKLNKLQNGKNRNQYSNVKAS
jgi:hypothetical protein